MVAEATAAAEDMARFEKEIAAAKAAARAPGMAVDLEAVARAPTRWHSDDEDAPPPPVFEIEPGRGRGKPALGKMKRSTARSADATAPPLLRPGVGFCQAWAKPGLLPSAKPPVKKSRERLASDDVIGEGAAAAGGDALEVFKIVVSKLEGKKLDSVLEMGKRLKTAAGCGLPELSELVKDTVTIVGPELWSVALAEAAVPKRFASPLPAAAPPAPPVASAEAPPVAPVASAAPLMPVAMEVEATPVVSPPPAEPTAMDVTAARPPPGESKDVAAREAFEALGQVERNV